jgi:hypothetical protein
MLKFKCFILFSFALLISCESEDDYEFEKMVSYFNSDDSHNFGQNCMTCHQVNGSGEGVFEIAGTVYDSQKINPYPNATIKLFTEPNGNGTLKYTLEVDALGNFYTTTKIDFGQGLYTEVQGNNQIIYMNTAISTGQCNSCHGSSTDKIWID